MVMICQRRRHPCYHAYPQRMPLPCAADGRSAAQKADCTVLIWIAKQIAVSNVDAVGLRSLFGTDVLIDLLVTCLPRQDSKQSSSVNSELITLL